MTRFKQYTSLDPEFVVNKLREFFAEDNIQDDITTHATQTDKRQVKGVFIAKEPLIFAGKEIIKQGFSECMIDDIVEDGIWLDQGDIIATMHGNIDTMLRKERVVLNLVQRLSGIASTTKKLSDITNQHNIELLDTRKTTPGLRLFEKFAVAVGGGTNHRFSLKDAVMIKDNHLIGNPDIAQAVLQSQQNNPTKDIQIEVDTKDQLEVVLQSRATSILLDNFKPDTLPNIINQIRLHDTGKGLYIELSGGIVAETLADFCIDGVDGISMGALTHNIKSKDISLDIK
tara:strand:- start:1000 stop:1857 length:858 start_codon:yes stop_codon:yes gene_type:complete